jgi:nitronate monooxygenase
VTVWSETELTRLVGLRYPLVQAPMAGGPSTPELVAAVSEAGALGSLGLAYTPPDAMRAAIQAVRDRTGRPFGVNLFVLTPPAPADLATASAVLDSFREELGLPQASPPPPLPFTVEDAYGVVLDERPSVFSFTFGIPPGELIAELRERGTKVVGTATTVAEAEALEQAGVDAIVAQGAEAGGHRGSFGGEGDPPLIGGLALVPQVVDAVSVPVVAAGGIMDGRGIAAALALGAAGAQLGTAFIPTPESGASDPHKRAILEGNEESTVVTPAFTGKHARGFRNRLVDELDPQRERLAPFPLQAAVAADVREEALRRGDPQFLTLLAGQGLRLARELPATALIAALVRETEATIARLGR